MTLSVIVALTLTPALCGTLLKEVKPHRRGFFGGFNRFYDATERKYKRKVISSIRRPVLMTGIYGVAGILLLGSVPAEGEMTP